MKLSMTALINFNINKKGPNEDPIKLYNNPGYRDLIDQAIFLNRLLKLSGNLNKLHDYQIKYRNGLMIGDLEFKDLVFRDKYLKWIYTHYSKSLTNHRMVQRNETHIFVKWANDFNRQHHNVRLIKVIPRVNEYQFHAKVLLIPFSVGHKLSFTLKDALTEEYHCGYDQAFYQFEKAAGDLVASIGQHLFNSCIPGIDLRLDNDIGISISNVARLEPLDKKKKSSGSGIKLKPVETVKPKVLASNVSRPLESHKNRAPEHKIRKATNVRHPRIIRKVIKSKRLGHRSKSLPRPKAADDQFWGRYFAANVLIIVPLSLIYQSELNVINKSLLAVPSSPNIRPDRRVAVQKSKASVSSKVKSSRSKGNLKEPARSESFKRVQPRKSSADQKTGDKSNGLSDSKDYITLIIIVSFIVIILLIFLFPLLRI